MPSIGNESEIESLSYFLKIGQQNFDGWKPIFLEMEEEELLSPDEIRKIENELELKLANMTLEDLEESSGPV